MTKITSISRGKNDKVEEIVLSDRDINWDQITDFITNALDETTGVTDRSTVQNGRRIYVSEGGYVTIKENPGTREVVIYTGLLSHVSAENLAEKMSNRYGGEYTGNDLNANRNIREAYEQEETYDGRYAVIEDNGVYDIVSPRDADRLRKNNDVNVIATGMDNRQNARNIIVAEGGSPPGRSEVTTQPDDEDVSTIESEDEYTSEESVRGPPVGMNDPQAEIIIYDDGEYEFTNLKTGEHHKASLSAMVTLQPVPLSDGDDFLVPLLITDENWDPGASEISDAINKITSAMKDAVR